MTYHESPRKYVVRRRENGCWLIKRFDCSRGGQAFEQSLQPTQVGTEPQGSEVATLAARLAELEAQLAATAEQANAPGDGVFAYETKRGTPNGFSYVRATAPPARAAATQVARPTTMPQRSSRGPISALAR